MFLQFVYLFIQLAEVIKLNVCDYCIYDTPECLFADRGIHPVQLLDLVGVTVLLAVLPTMTTKV